MATTLSIENRRDDNNGRPTRASIVAPPGGTFLALDNDGGNAGEDAVGKARGRAEDGGIANAGLDGLLSVAASDATATSSYSRSAGVDDVEVASGGRHRPTTTMTVADAASIDDDEATNGIAGGTPREDPADGTPRKKARSGEAAAKCMKAVAAIRGGREAETIEEEAEDASINDDEVASGGRHHPNTATTIANAANVNDKEGLLASKFDDVFHSVRHWRECQC
jgi:hypothetical protein